MKKGFFVKMNGAGNDFIIFDKELNPDLSLDAGQIDKICDRHFGIGADGLITIEDSDIYDFNMQYFNSDGSTGSLCGNGARCAIKYAKDSGRLKSNIAEFISNGVKYTGEVLQSSLYRLNLNPPADVIPRLEIFVDSKKINASFVNSGSPHVIINFDELKILDNYKNLDEVPVFKYGREIRYSKSFKSSGTNVNFIFREDNMLRIRTYERGVENETLACGTGAVASALIGFLLYKIYPPVKLMTKGGEELIVNFEYSKENFYNVSLTGRAVTVFNGEFLFPAIQVAAIQGKNIY